jgi:Ni/Co efflux regulator RcnB
MRRFLILLALISLAIPTIAEAQHGHGRGGGHGDARGERRFHDEDRGQRGGGWSQRGARHDPRHDGYRAKPGKPGKPPNRAPYPNRPDRRVGLGRGQTMPSQFRGPRMEDYGRYRLRRPPPGYSYHRRGNSAFLVSDDTGMIFEVVPIGR